MITTGWRAFGPAMELGEGARWVDGRLVQVDLLAGQLHQADPVTGEMSVLARLDVPLGAVAPVAGRSGRWIAAAGTGIALLSAGFTAEWVVEVVGDSPTPIRMNDGVCDRSGRFWAGTMAYDPSPRFGALYRVDSDLTVTRVLGGIAIPNGPAFDDAGTVMYLADSAVGVIYRFTLTASGELKDRDEFTRVDGAPDGMTVDAENHLWSAVWGAGVIHRYAPSGALVEVVAVPALQPTSIAIGGGHMVVTSATHGLDRPGQSDGRTFVAPCAVAGLPTTEYRLLRP